MFVTRLLIGRRVLGRNDASENDRPPAKRVKKKDDRAEKKKREIHQKSERERERERKTPRRPADDHQTNTAPCSVISARNGRPLPKKNENPVKPSNVR